MSEESTEDGPRYMVLLEAAANDDASFVDIGTARAVLSAMGDDDGVALRARDRLAVQVEVHAPDMALALAAALARWRLAAERLPKGWQVVLAEVVTPEEFKNDHEPD